VPQICGVFKQATQRRKSLDISAECRIPRHAAPFHTTPRDAALVPRDAAFVPQLLHKTIHLSAATVDSVWHLCSKVF
jgi:hypothetical protein